MTANDKQVAGSHYKGNSFHGIPIDHWDVVAIFNLDYFQGQITKYVMRYNKKNGVEDLRKAVHYLEKYLEILTTPKFSYDSGYTVIAHNQFGAPDTVEIKTDVGLLDYAWHKQPPSKLQALQLGVTLYPQVKPDGWVNAQYEGTDQVGALWRCRKCHQHFRSPHNACPDDYHGCRLDSSDGAGPDSSYTNQDKGNEPPKGVDRETKDKAHQEDKWACAECKGTGRISESDEPCTHCGGKGYETLTEFRAKRQPSPRYAEHG